MKVLFGFIKSIAPYLLVVWVILILVFSSLPKLPDLNLDLGRFGSKIYYVFHFCEYMALAGLALLSFAKSALTFNTRRVLIVLMCLLVFAALDETHQLLIPARAFEIKDMLSNFAGIFTGILITLRLNRM